MVGFADSKATDTQITGAGQMLGTPIYMSPEQARSPSEVGPPADVYSLGVLLYEMVTGAPPFTADRAVDVVVRHSLEKPRPLPACGGLDEMIMWMLEKNPAARPASSEIEQELLLIADGLPETDPGLPLGSAAMIAFEDLELPLEEPVTFPGV